MSFGNFNQENDEQPMAEINTTPLVDVMLVLLIVFMITMPVLTQSIPLELPKTATEKPNDSIAPVRVAVDAQGQIFFGTEKVSSLETKQRLKAAVTKNPDLVLAISADRQVAYEHIANLLANAQSVGIHKIGFVTETNQKK